MQTRPMGPTNIRAYAGYHVVMFTFASCPMEAFVPDRGEPLVRDVSGRAWFLRRLPITPYLRRWIAETYAPIGAAADAETAGA